ncbi:hypothetical protein GBA52_018127 [Prunus armeniaca]|nr:hypothetical protein GBA52_018127 [Prunus armeniaca]
MRTSKGKDTRKGREDLRNKLCIGCFGFCIFSREREAFLRLVNLEIELYNGMVEKEGTDGEKDALKAYKVAHDESDSTSVEAEGDEVSSALIDKVAVAPNYLNYTLGKEGIQELIGNLSKDKGE